MNKDLKQWLKVVKATKGDNTYKAYLQAMKNWFPNSDNVDLSLDYLTKRLDSFNVAQNTKVLRCRALKGFLTHYGYNHRIKDHEAILKLINSVHQKKVVAEVVSHEQYIKIRSMIREDWLRIVVDLLYKNGLRISEATHILTENFNEADSKITLFDTKNGNDYKIYLTKGLTKDIADFIRTKKKQTVWLFDNKGKARDVKAVGVKIKNYCDEAGFEGLTAHSFRHGSAVFMLEHGMDIYKIKEHLHHKSIKSTERYLHMTPKQIEQVTSIFENA